MVVKCVDAEAESAVHGLEGSVNEFPVIIVIYKCFGVVVLEISNRYEPPAEHNPRSAVVVGEVH